MSEETIDNLINRRTLISRRGFLNQSISSLTGKTIILYGAGAFGRQTCRALRKNGIPVSAFLDKNAQPGQTLFGIPVRIPAYDCLPGIHRYDMIVIISIVLTAPARREIISSLEKIGYQNIIDAQTIRAQRVPYSSGKMEPAQEDLQNERDAILSAHSLVADEESRTIFTGNLRAHLERGYDDTPESIGTIQYLEPKVPRGMRLSRIVDCGAYTGDTLSSLAKGGNTRAYAGFEPGRKSFVQLTKAAAAFKDTIACSLYPYAVSDHTGTMNFSDIAGSGSLDAAGPVPVPVVRLDDTLRDFGPTMIKMDIEGEEFRALLGARKIIREYRPDLAICVYHYISDLWRIPNLINSWDLGYSFYLRTHSSATMETVLYGIPREG